MKKIRLFALILALILTLSASAAQAESIFNIPEDEETELPSLRAPSYGAMANVAEDRVEPSADGGTIVTYLGVSASEANEFGVYLGRLGFSVTKQEQEEGRLGYAVSDGLVSFTMIYNQAEKSMQLIYPKGTDYEVSLFPGYTRINAGQELTIPGLGRITFHPFFLNDKVTCADWYLSLYPKADGLAVQYKYSWLPFTFYNTSAKNVRYGPHSGNDLFTVRLVYHMEDGTYVYEDNVYRRGRYLADRKAIAASRVENNKYHLSYAFTNKPCEPLTAMDCAAVFDLPESLRTSTGGTIAVELDFLHGERFVLMLRENGADLNLAPAAAQ